MDYSLVYHRENACTSVKPPVRQERTTPHVCRLNGGKQSDCVLFTGS